MERLGKLWACAVIASLVGCSSGKAPVIKISFNSTVTEKRVIEIVDSPVVKDAASGDFVVKQGSKEVQSQVYTDPISKSSSLLIYPDPTNKEPITFHTGVSGSETFAPLAYAELWKKEGGQFGDHSYTGGEYVQIDSVRVPDENSDNILYFKYEGPGWESNHVAYRFYLDWRNANDIFGKRTENMELAHVGQDGDATYHELNDWGMDIFKVGNSLGIGSIGYWNGEKALRVEKTDSLISKILASGPLRATIQTDYYGWQTDSFKVHATSYLSIDGNSRLTKEVLVFDNAPANICTGIHANEVCEVMKTEKGNWVALASWGIQSLNNDSLGLVVFAPKSAFAEYQTDPDNHLIILKPEGNKVSWYFGACWEMETNGIKTNEAFKAYIDQQLELLNNPDKE